MYALGNRSALRSHVSSQKSGSAGKVKAPASPALIGTNQDRRPFVRAAAKSDARSGTGFFSSFGTISLGGGAKPAVAADARVAPKAKDVIFVAGSTGRLGARIVRELLEAGYKVRAGARNVEDAQKSMQVAVTYGLLSADAAKRVQFVPLDLDDTSSLLPAIGNASKVVCAVGAAEREVLKSDGPKKVDGDGSIALVEAARDAGVEQFVLVTSLGTGKLGFPAGVLNLFWGVLIWKRQAEKALEASGMVYTIVRPGGMERPKDDFKKTNNMVLNARDTTFGGLVSRLQVAELVTSILDNPAASENKVLEVTAEPTAPLMSYADLLKGIKSDISREEQLSRAAIASEARSQKSSAERALEAAKSTLEDAEARVAELADRLKTFQAQESEVKSSASAILKEGAAAEKELEAAVARARKAALSEKAAKAVLEQARKAAATGDILSKKEQQDIFNDVMNPKEGAARSASPRGSGSRGTGFFGSGSIGSGLSGLFGGSSVEQEKKEEVEEPKAAPPKEKAAPANPFANILGASMSVEAEKEEEEKVAAPSAPPLKKAIAPPAQKPATPTNPFASLFGASVQAEAEAEEQEEEEEKEATTTAPPPKRAAPPSAQKAAAPAAATPAPAKEEAKVQEKAKGGFMGFGNLFGGGAAMQLEDDVKSVNVEPPRDRAPTPPAAAEPAPPTPTPTPSSAPAPAPKTTPVAAKPAPPPPKEEEKPFVPIPQRSAASIKEEEDIVARVLAEARAAREGVAVIPSKAAAAAKPPASAPAPAPAPAKPAAAPAPAPAAAKPAASATAVADSEVAAKVAASKKEAQEWIDAWKKRMGEDK